jgi:hypothetical protein
LAAPVGVGFATWAAAAALAFSARPVVMPVEEAQAAATIPTTMREMIGATKRLVIRRRGWVAMLTSRTPPSLGLDGIELEAHGGIGI